MNQSTMNKAKWMVATVLALMAGTYFADKATRLPGKSSDRADRAIAAPEVTLKDLSGRDVSLSQYRGKVVLVNFWATWCDPCRLEIPWLIEMQQKYSARGFTVLGVAMDDEGASVVAPFVRTERFEANGAKAQMNYPILIGNEAVAAKFGGLIGFPTSMLINRDGKIIQRITGLISYDDIAKAIEAHL